MSVKNTKELSRKQEQDRIIGVLTKITKRDMYRLNDDNEVFAKALIFIIENMKMKPEPLPDISKAFGEMLAERTQQK